MAYVKRRPKTAITPEIIGNRRILHWTIAECDSWGCGNIGRKADKHLTQRIGDTRKLCARWVPQLLNADQSNEINYFRKNAWIESIEIRLILCGNLSPWKRHGSTTIRQKRKSNRSSGWID
ncbi:hypothetical protein TNCV_973551 [Trichonephila clavipes]|nr:hypothetical protein TNCV_973551 [Trichonephila clavipes]